MKKKGMFSNLLYLIKLTGTYSPRFILLEILNGVIMGVFSSADVVFIKIFYDALAREMSFRRILTIIATIIVVAFLHQLWFQFYRNVLRPISQQKLQTDLNACLFNHARKLDLACYEQNEFYNNFVWAMSKADTQISALLQTISNTITMVVAICVTTTILTSVSLTLALFTIAASVLTVVLQRLVIKNKYQHSLDANIVNRKTGYYERIFYTADHAKELRISRVANTLLRKYHNALLEKRDLAIKYGYRGLKFELPLTISSKLMQPLVYLVLLYQILVKGIGTISGIAVTFSAFWNLRGRIQAVIDLGIRISELSLYTEKIKAFLETEPTISYGNNKINDFASLECNNVSFGYVPHKQVLHDINFRINKGEKIAIVGYNGSGKTTFIKLLLRLYDQTSGQILYNCQSASSYSRETLCENLGTVFQDYQLYALPICENVLCNNYSLDKKNDVIDALQKASFDIDGFHLDNGIETELTKEFYRTGINLSGGEKQKVAIARVFAHDFGLIIMDEPSASLDPKAEYELYNHIDDVSKDTAVIFISHRLSTTKNADFIYMFDNGRIVEAGTHTQLMELNGKYAEMFNLQAEKFRT